MSENGYFENTTDVIPYTRAKDTDVDTPLAEIKTAFDKMVYPHPDKKGFRDALPVGEAEEKDEAVTANQLITAGLIIGTDTGTAGVYEVEVPIGLSTYENNMLVGFVATTNNASSSTLNVSGLGAKSLRKHDGTELLANDIVTGQVVIAFYSTINEHFRIISNTPGSNESAAASADAAEISAAAAAASAIEVAGIPVTCASTQSSSFTAGNRILYPLDTSGGSFDVTLPSDPEQGDRVLLVDISDGRVENPVTILRNGNKINNLDEDWTLDTTWLVELWFVGESWRVTI